MCVFDTQARFGPHIFDLYCNIIINFIHWYIHSFITVTTYYVSDMGCLGNTEFGNEVGSLAME